MGLGQLFRRDQMTIAKVFKRLQNEATLSKDEVREILAARQGGFDTAVEAGGEITATGKYITDAEGNLKFGAGISLDPPELAEAMGLEEANIDLDTGRTVEQDADNAVTVRVWVRTTYSGKAETG